MLPGCASNNKRLTKKGLAEGPFYWLRQRAASAGQRQAPCIDTQPARVPRPQNLATKTEQGGRRIQEPKAHLDALRSFSQQDPCIVLSEKSEMINPAVRTRQGLDRKAGPWISPGWIVRAATTTNHRGRSRRQRCSRTGPKNEGRQREEIAISRSRRQPTDASQPKSVVSEQSDA